MVGGVNRSSPSGVDRIFGLSGRRSSHGRTRPEASGDPSRSHTDGQDGRSGIDVTSPVDESIRDDSALDRDRSLFTSAHARRRRPAGGRDSAGGVIRREGRRAPRPAAAVTSMRPGPPAPGASRRSVPRAASIVVTAIGRLPAGGGTIRRRSTPDRDRTGPVGTHPPDDGDNRGLSHHRRHSWSPARHSCAPRGGCTHGGSSRCDGSVWPLLPCRGRWAAVFARHTVSRRERNTWPPSSRRSSAASTPGANPGRTTPPLLCT
jgi:hypothetical protein